MGFDWEGMSGRYGADIADWYDDMVDDAECKESGKYRRSSSDYSEKREFSYMKRDISIIRLVKRV